MYNQNVYFISLNNTILYKNFNLSNFLMLCIHPEKLTLLKMLLHLSWLDMKESFICIVIGEHKQTKTQLSVC